MMSTPISPVIHFHDPAFLRAHIAQTMSFYHPRAIDPAGGFFHYFRDDGSLYETQHRHLVSSTRFIFNYAMAYAEFKNPDYLAAVQHGLHYLRTAHRNPETGGYFWTLRDSRAEDTTNHAYGLAFVMLAYSCALHIGITQANNWLDETWELLERYFWDKNDELYRDEADAQWHFSHYRGQNANMHLCEALLAAFEVSHKPHYLQRAFVLADHITRRQTKETDGLIWEHYDQHWNIDWDYNRDNPKHLFRPWGFQTGHQTEWAKLLLLLQRHAQPLSQLGTTTNTDWLIPKAKYLFDKSLELGWDSNHGGLCYGFDPQGNICDDDKYFWVQAESIAAAAQLAHSIQDEPTYGNSYQALWKYAWTYFIDHQYGGWYRILRADNQKYNDEKSPAGKTDYHTMGACYETLKLLRQYPDLAKKLAH